jgi:integrase/recombinase XerC
MMDYFKGLEPVALRGSVGVGARGIKKSESRTVVICSCGCGEELVRRMIKVNPSGLNYVSVQHQGAHRARVYLEESCGSFLGIVTELLDGFASQHYKNLSTIRTGVCPFVLFLSERGIVTLEQVTPKMITEFIAWSEEVEYKNAAHQISVLSAFFKWAIRHGHRRSACPVVPQFHGQKRAHHLPRPYSAEEMVSIWDYAYQRGSRRVRAVLAIGEEAGLRLGEICRLKVDDVDLAGRRLFVRLPNKTDCERWAMFSDKAARYIFEWMVERSDDCGHDLLFHNTLGAGDDASRTLPYLLRHLWR